MTSAMACHSRVAKCQRLTIAPKGPVARLSPLYPLSNPKALQQRVARRQSSRKCQDSLSPIGDLIHRPASSRTTGYGAGAADGMAAGSATTYMPYSTEMPGFECPRWRFNAGVKAIPKRPCSVSQSSGPLAC